MTMRNAWCFLICSLSLLLAQALQAQSPPATQTLTPLEPGVPASKFYGQAMSSNGSYLAISAPNVLSSLTPGTVLLYRRVSGLWTFVQHLQAPVPANGDGYGTAVQFAGQQLLIGAPYATVSGASARGALYVYTLVANVYTLNDTVQPGVALGAGSAFGFHVHADGGWLAVGAPLSGAGRVQIYYYDSDIERWIYHSQFLGAQTSVRHGIRVLVNGDRLLASATEEVLTGATRGYVYEYQRTGTGATATWAQVQRFRPTSATNVSVFGSALALSPTGDSLLVGAPFEAPAGNQDGAVFEFTRGVGGAWTEAARINPPSATALNFGGSIAYSNVAEVLIGDIRESDVGAAYRYRKQPSGSWTRQSTFARGSGGVSEDFMGSAVLAIGDEAIISASGINGTNGDEGRTFVFAGALPLFRDGLE